MAHEYFKCKLCGTVQRHKDDTGIQRLFENLDQPCANSHCNARGFKDYEVSIGKTDVGNANARDLARRMVAFGREATTIPGQITINYFKRRPNNTVYFEPQVSINRSISDALDRLAKGGLLPQDVNNRSHFHDGGKYMGGGLPISNVKQATTYYREYGILSSSRGWELNLSSERLVVGSCGEIYYSALHYRPGGWWVFNDTRGAMGWRQFSLRT